MIRLLVLISLIFQMAPQNIWLASYAPAGEVIIEFGEEPQLAIGTAVVAAGQFVGKVRKIEAIESAGSIAHRATVSLDNPAIGNFVRSSSVALISSAWSASRRRNISFVELLSPDLAPIPAAEVGAIAELHARFLRQ